MEVEDLAFPLKKAFDIKATLKQSHDDRMITTDSIDTLVKAVEVELL